MCVRVSLAGGAPSECSGHQPTSGYSDPPTLQLELLSIPHDEPLPVIERVAPMPHVSLDARKSQLKVLREEHDSFPVKPAGGVGPWSAVPIWQGLDSDFLCSPAIPKAPPAPRLKVEMVGSTLRISDDDVAESVGRAIQPQRTLPQNRLLLAFAFVGFVGGIVAAWLLGALR